MHLATRPKPALKPVICLCKNNICSGLILFFCELRTQIVVEVDKEMETDVETEVEKLVEKEVEKEREEEQVVKTIRLLVG